MLSIVPGCKVYFPSAITVIIPETVFSSVDFEPQPAKQSIETAAITAVKMHSTRRPCFLCSFTIRFILSVSVIPAEKPVSVQKPLFSVSVNIILVIYSIRKA